MRRLLVMSFVVLLALPAAPAEACPLGRFFRQRRPRRAAAVFICPSCQAPPQVGRPADHTIGHQAGPGEPLPPAP
ncbi:MAG TPA: hypothetical protein VFB80_13625 [Pirellulaceae bacterium]|nr:hypothetical protein [Pirellulaceae bacterium]